MTGTSAKELGRVSVLVRLGLGVLAKEACWCPPNVTDSPLAQIRYWSSQTCRK
jgi:hypothetical protein